MVKHFVQKVLQWMRRSHASCATRPTDNVSTRFVFEPLEPRLLLSADWGSGLDDPELIAMLGENRLEPAVVRPLLTGNDVAVQLPTRHELVFVDSGI